MKEEFGVFWKVRRRTEGIFVRWERRQVGVGGDLRVDEMVGLLSTWCVARPTFWHFWVPCFFLGRELCWGKHERMFLVYLCRYYLLKYILDRYFFKTKCIHHGPRLSFTAFTLLLILMFKSVLNDTDFEKLF